VLYEDRIEIRVNPQVLAALDALSKEYKKSRAQIIRELILHGGIKDDRSTWKRKRRKRSE
jgi:predicted DNA-binding protein